MNDLAPITAEDNAIWRPSAALNPQRLEYLWGLTDRIAWSTSVPETLRGTRDGQKFTPFDDRTVLANVFAVVEQADRWNISPFALLGAAAIVRGKLAFEGKVIAAVLESQFGVKLFPYFRGTPKTDGYHVYLCDEELPADVLAELTPGYRHDRYRILDGSVAGWKTSGNGSPWRPETYGDMLIYRGTRQWARVHRAAAILGVLADDEVENFDMERRALAATPTTAQRFAAPAARSGFDAEAVSRQLEQTSTLPMGTVDLKTGEVDLVPKTTEEQPGTSAKTQSGPTTSDKPADDDAGGSGNAGTNSDSTRVQDNSSDDSQSSSLAAGDSGTGSDGGSSSPAGTLTRAVFLKYATTIARYKSAENVKKGSAEFFKAENITGGTDAERALFATIRDQFIATVISGQIKVEAFLGEVQKWIEQDVPEAEKL